MDIDSCFAAVEKAQLSRNLVNCTDYIYAKFSNLVSESLVFTTDSGKLKLNLFG